MKASEHRLWTLEDVGVGQYRIHVQSLKQLHLSGWRGFALVLKDRDGALSSPVVEGIYSAGGKDQVKPWMDISLAECVEFESGKRISLHHYSLTQEVFRALSSLIPPGGHMMVAYEDEDPIHRRTYHALSKGAPPVVTALGFLLFVSGFRLVKDWYLAEGGHEGPRKLWGEKPPDRSWALVWDEETATQIVNFFNRWKNAMDRQWIEELQEHARKIFPCLDIKDSALRQRVESVL